MPTHPRLLILILAALVAFAPLSIDTYLPSLPSIAKDLNAPMASIQMTIGVFLAGLCIGMLFCGPLSDRYGRKPVLLAGMAVYLAASVGCMLAPSAEQLIVWRFLQALGGAAASVLGRAIVRDVFSIKDAARTLSLMHLVSMITTLVAPLAGSFLMMIEGWRTIFAGLFGFALICLVASIWYVPETHTADKRSHSLTSALGGYGKIARDPTAVAFILCMGLSFGGMFAFITASPQVYIEFFGVTPQTYGWLFALNIGGVIVMTSLNARMVSRVGPMAMLSVGAATMGIASILLGALGANGALGLEGIVFLVVLYVSVTGLIGANCIASLLVRYPKNSGAAAGLAVSTQFALGAAFSAVVGGLSDGTEQPMCLVMLVAGVGSSACYLVLRILGSRRTPV